VRKGSAYCEKGDGKIGRNDFMNPCAAKPKLVVICGPTGVGKTAAAVGLAESFKAEIISADSMQIYRNMDIGTAKPTAEEQARVRHHMIDLIDPDEHFDAAQYGRMAREKIFKLHADGVLPFVVGGTGLYIKSLLHGMFHSRSADPSIRKRLKEEAAENGSRLLYDRLKKYDPDTAARLHTNDTYRIIRALETLEASGKTISKYHQEHRFSDEPFVILKIGLNIDRASLYDRIDHRVDAMISAGFVDEVEKLLAMGFGAELKSLQSIGYRHMVDFIQGRLTWDETIRTLKRDTRRFAKRQLTWFGADKAIIWENPSQIKSIKKTIEAFLKEASRR
jgi:tRNA dimethylallyltransferase